MSQKTGVPPSHRFTKSLPVDFRFMDSPTSDRIGYADINLGNNGVINLSSPERHGDSGVKVVERVKNGIADTEQGNEDSPYSGNVKLVENRPSVGDEDLDSAAAPLPSISKSNIGNRWSDITTYATKKAIETRDALAKSIYACLFEWLVEQINKSLAVGKRLTGRSISILDIYGFESFDVNESDEVLVKSSFLAELQRRVLKAEAALREKEEENDILHQRLLQYENRWSEYELKMKSMEEVWQKQMRSLQSSLSIAKKSLAVDESERSSDASVNTSDDREYCWEAGNNLKVPESNGLRPMSAGLSVISRLAEEFEQRSQVFGDDAKFLVEVKSGQVDASLNPDRELRRLKQMFETWKKDYATRLRETKVVLNKLGSEEGALDKVKKKFWGRRNSTRYV
ncbi:hypothetical protein V6N13_106343 [Hibiscus sabdariffa]